MELTWVPFQSSGVVLQNSLLLVESVVSVEPEIIADFETA